MARMPIGRGKKPGKSSSAPQAPEEHHVICPDFDVQPDSEPEDSQGTEELFIRDKLSLSLSLSRSLGKFQKKETT